MNHTKGLIVYAAGVIVLLGALVGLAVFVDSRLEPPTIVEKIIEVEKIVEVERVVEVIVEKIVEVTPEPVSIKCWFAASPPGLPMLNIPFTDVGPPPPGYTGTIGYLCNDTMRLQADLPIGAEVLNIEAHLGATRGVSNGN